MVLVGGEECVVGDDDGLDGCIGCCYNVGDGGLEEGGVSRASFYFAGGGGDVEGLAMEGEGGDGGGVALDGGEEVVVDGGLGLVGWLWGEGRD